jgi:hypothetical protein
MRYIYRIHRIHIIFYVHLSNKVLYINRITDIYNNNAIICIKSSRNSIRPTPDE